MSLVSRTTAGWGTCISGISLLLVSAFQHVHRGLVFPGLAGYEDRYYQVVFSSVTSLNCIHFGWSPFAYFIQPSWPYSRLSWVTCLPLFVWAQLRGIMVCPMTNHMGPSIEPSDKGWEHFCEMRSLRGFRALDPGCV